VIFGYLVIGDFDLGIAITKSPDHQMLQFK